MIYEIKAVDPVEFDQIVVPTIFLAGSIEMGEAKDWQKLAISHWRKRLEEWEVDPKFDLVVLNPRRDNWESSWVQSIHNEKFTEQVVWELDGIVQSDYQLVCFDPQTKSPITLFEYGVMSADGAARTTVICPEGFWRRGNVDVIGMYFAIPVFEDFETGLDDMLKNILLDHGVKFTH